MKRILINRREDGHMTALANNGKLLELIWDDEKKASIAGNIYAGIVKNINTGFIFLDIGLEKPAFLDTRDPKEQNLFRGGRLTVNQGNTLIVQIIKDSVGDKGPAATSNVSHAGRFVVLFQALGLNKINVSRKIDNPTEAERLAFIGKTHVPPGFSAILRSAAAGRDEEEIAAEIGHILSKFGEHPKWQLVKGPAVLSAEPPILKTLWEIAAEDADEVIADDAETHNLIAPHFPNVQFYEKNNPIFGYYFLETQISKIKEKRVWLGSGSYIVIERTEACVVIDVNSGKLTGKRDSQVKINLEAAKEIAYQLRLRNLSGIIIVDFITMK